MIQIAVAALCAAAGTCLAADQQALLENLKAGKPQTIVTYGTSLTAGGAWVQQLQVALDRSYPGLAKVVNSGEGGMWSKWGVENLDARVIAKKPDAVFIEFGINDAFLEYKTTPEEARHNLENMIERILKANPQCQIILMTMNPPIGVHFERRPNVDTYYENYRQVAKDRQLLLIDHNPNWKKVLQQDAATFNQYVPDGIHPDATGCEKIILPQLLTSLGLTESAAPEPALPPDLQPVTPRFRPVSNGDDYKWAMGRHEDLVKQAHTQPIEVALYGDSLTQFFDNDVWAREMAPLKAGNFGISSDKVENLLWRVQHGEADGMKLKLAVVMIGTNNLGAPAPGPVAAGIELVLKEIAQRQPQARILLLGIPPAGWNKTDGTRSSAKAINALLAEFKARKLCDAYLDWGDVLLEPDGSQSKALVKDGWHFTKAGYEAYVKAVKPMISKCLQYPKPQ
jgi:lysophospholipase L1-like esterase